MEKIELLDLLFFEDETSTIKNIGLIVDRSIIPNLQVNDDNLYVWELDGEDNMTIFGTYFHETSNEERLKSFHKIVLGKLKNNPLKNKEKVKDVLEKIHSKYFKKPYDYSMTSCLSFIYPWIKKLSCHLFDAKIITCSEFIATVLIELEVLNAKVNVNEISPINFYDISTCTLNNKKYITEDIIDQFYNLK